MPDWARGPFILPPRPRTHCAHHPEGAVTRLEPAARLTRGGVWRVGRGHAHAAAWSQSAKLTPTGFEYDRTWCFVDLDGTAVSQYEAISMRKVRCRAQPGTHWLGTVIGVRPSHNVC